MGAIPQIRKKLQSPLGKTRQRNQVHPLVPHCFYCSRRFVRRSFPSLFIVPRLHQDPLFFRPLPCHVMASLPATVCLASAWHHPSHPFLPFLGCPVRLQVSSSFVHCPAIASRHFFPLSGARRFPRRDYQKRPRRSEAPIINAAIKQAL